MAKQNDTDATDTKVETIKCAVVRGAEGLDLEACMKAAEESFLLYQENDKVATAAVIESVQKILTSEKPAHKALKHITASTMAKMAIGLMGEIPDQSLCEETEVRVKAFLSGQGDKFLHVARGRNSGYWFKDRLTAEELKKVSKSDA